MHIFPTIETFFGQRRGSWGGHQLCQLFSPHYFDVWCMLNVVTAEVYSVNLNILCSFLHILFFFQIAFSQHNSIMDLVQFFVTFFRWVSRRYTRWQLPQVRPPTPPRAQSRPSTSAQQQQAFGGLCDSRRACVCCCQPEYIYVRCGYVCDFASSSDDCLQPAPRCQWPSGQHRRMMSSVEAEHHVPPGELGVTLASLC